MQHPQQLGAVRHEIHALGQLVEILPVERRRVGLDAALGEIEAEALLIDVLLFNFAALEHLPHPVVVDLIMGHIRLSERHADFRERCHQRLKRTFAEIKQRIIDVQKHGPKFHLAPPSPFLV